MAAPAAVSHVVFRLEQTASFVCIPTASAAATSRYNRMDMRAAWCVKIIGPMAVSALVFGTAVQPTGAQSVTPAQPPSEQPTQQPTEKQAASPASVADAARASKRLRESSPPAKVYRNKDLRDPTEAELSPAAPTTTPAAVSKAEPSPTSRETTLDAPSVPQGTDFETQGNILRNQVRIQKGTILDIQNQMTSLKDQLLAWNEDFSQNDYAPLCWSSFYSWPAFKGWCDTGRNLQAQYDGLQRQLDQEKARLDQMQEAIRRKGYGNSVYDPD